MVTGSAIGVTTVSGPKKTEKVSEMHADAVISVETVKESAFSAAVDSDQDKGRGRKAEENSKVDVPGQPIYSIQIWSQYQPLRKDTNDPEGIPAALGAHDSLTQKDKRCLGCCCMDFHSYSALDDS